MAEKGNQAADMQGQQGTTSAQVQQDASSANQQDASSTNQQRVEGTSRESQQRVEITLESLKTVMRCVAKEVFDEGRSQQQQQQQPESLPSGGTTGKRK